jgi:hypothetical protein
LSPTTRIAALAVAGGVAVAPLAAPAAASAHPVTTRPAATAHPATKNAAAAAAGYLVRQLQGKDKDHYVTTFTSGKTVSHFVNYGETADAVLSMDAAGVSQTAAKRATKYLRANVASYIGSATGTTGFSPGAIAKVMLVAEAQHSSIRSFGGADLVADLLSTEGNGTPAGEYQQNPPGTPAQDAFFSTVSQALPVLALANDPRATGQPDSAAVTFLANQQCSDGGFPSALASNPSQACAAGQDVDSTGYAVQALLATGDHLDAEQGIAWLKKVQHSNGSFGSPNNSNSTALAIQALTQGHASLGGAEKWLRKQVVGCSGPVARRGAVVFNQRTYDDRDATGLDRQHGGIVEVAGARLSEEVTPARTGRGFHSRAAAIRRACWYGEPWSVSRISEATAA